MIKYSSETYLKGVLKHSIKIFVDDDLPYFIVVKKIIKIEKPFVLNEYGNDIIILNDGYYVLEYIPIHNNYICRIFIDTNFNIIEKIFLFSKGNKLQNGIPIYDDLKICYILIDDKWKLYNEDVFNKMLYSKELDNETYRSIMNQINDVKKVKLPFDYKKYLY